MPRGLARLLTGVCALAGTLCVAALAGQSDAHLRTEDHNRDGRPDVWRTYDRHGALARVALDTNFDGRSDVQEYYERGALVRRESDRDFNDRIDLIQEFDSRTSASRRSVIDVDFDGTADLLVLFQGERPIVTKRTHEAPHLPVPAPARFADDQLATLADPFASDPALRPASAAEDDTDSAESSVSSGLSPPDRHVSNPLIALKVDIAIDASPLPPTPVSRFSPRGPPQQTTAQS